MSLETLPLRGPRVANCTRRASASHHAHGREDVCFRIAAPCADQAPVNSCTVCARSSGRAWGGAGPAHAGARTHQFAEFTATRRDTQRPAGSIPISRVFLQNLYTPNNSRVEAVVLDHLAIPPDQPGPPVEPSPAECRLRMMSRFWPRFWPATPSAGRTAARARCLSGSRRTRCAGARARCTPSNVCGLQHIASTPSPKPLRAAA